MRQHIKSMRQHCITRYQAWIHAYRRAVLFGAPQSGRYICVAVLLLQVIYKGSAHWQEHLASWGSERLEESIIYSLPIGCDKLYILQLRSVISLCIHAVASVLVLGGQTYVYETCFALTFCPLSFESCASSFCLSVCSTLTYNHLSLSASTVG